MKALLESLLLLALAAFGGSKTYDSYRTGKMPLGFRGFSPLFDRFEDAPFFWGATAVNVMVSALCAIGGILILVAGVLR